jgi:hypothetical protein
VQLATLHEGEETTELWLFWPQLGVAEFLSKTYGVVELFALNLQMRTAHDEADRIAAHRELAELAAPFESALSAGGRFLWDARSNRPTEEQLRSLCARLRDFMQQ